MRSACDERHTTVDFSREIAPNGARGTAATRSPETWDGAGKHRGAMSFGTSTRAGARVMGFYHASPPYRALGLAGLEAGGAHFVIAEFANEKMTYRS
jgi:hypothetical protein